MMMISLKSPHTEIPELTNNFNAKATEQTKLNKFGEQNEKDLVNILLNKNNVNQKHYQFLPSQTPTSIPSRFFQVNT